jgi:serine-type D-Ala-D-Ala carboxypeptidase/endopeptidase (penicillin-binding protein 4)
MKINYRLVLNKNGNVNFHNNILSQKKFANPWSFIICCTIFFLSSCSVSKKIGKQANDIVLEDSVISTGHAGISIYEPATDKYWYNYDATKFFVPASNTKLFSLYAGMKYLGDSLIGLRYQQTDTSLIIYPTGDPSFLHPDFKQQQVFEFLKNKNNISYASNHFTDGLGSGWAWDDYMDDYMVQRSEFPIYANLATISASNGTLGIVPKIIPLRIQKGVEKNVDPNTMAWVFSRKWDINDITATIAGTNAAKKEYQIPYIPNDIPGFLSDTLHQKINAIDNNLKGKKLSKIYSQPTDSLFKPMMYTSDNFFAEQTLLMASNEHLGYMSDDAMIDTLLKTDLKDIPQKPYWLDGSGLSRYNLFSPQSMVYIIHKMQKEFGIQRLKGVLPTGGQGTIKNYYKSDSGFIYAKTGSLSNVIAFSGFLYTKKSKLIIFSVLVNGFQGSATKVRRSVEKFLEGVREDY